MEPKYWDIGDEALLNLVPAPEPPTDPGVELRERIRDQIDKNVREALLHFFHESTTCGLGVDGVYVVIHTDVEEDEEGEDRFIRKFPIRELLEDFVANFKDEDGSASELSELSALLTEMSGRVKQLAASRS
jgi:hypothetical protein